jgi:hypothetical protein
MSLYVIGKDDQSESNINNNEIESEVVIIHQEENGNHELDVDE